MDLTMSVVESL